MTTSVIVPLHDGAATVAETLASVRAASSTTVEVIVVDDRSSDDGPSIARAAGARVIGTPRAGPSAARNAGLREASGDVIVFCDADDTLDAGAIDARRARLASSSTPETAFLVSRHRLLWPNRATTRAGVPDVRNDARDVARVCRRSQSPPVGFTFPRALLQGDAPFDEELRYFEDWDLTLRLLAGGARMVGFDVEDCSYRQRAAMATTSPEAADAALLVIARARVDVPRLCANGASAGELRAALRATEFEMLLWRASVAARSGRVAGAAADVARAALTSPARVPFIPLHVAQRALARRRRLRAAASG